MDKVFHPANSRGRADHGWLKANFSFSFANFYDPEKVQFGLLRVLNDDLVQPGTGFAKHPHQDMEIISIPLAGSIRHMDSMNHSAEIKAGEVQVMSAGTGVEHSEFNKSDEELNLLQIWILPDARGHEPQYAQKDFSELLRSGELVNIVSPKSSPSPGSLTINQNAYLHLGNFKNGREIEYRVKDKNNGTYIFLIEGSAKIQNDSLETRDAIGIWDVEKFTIEFTKESKVLLIEVPMN